MKNIIKISDICHEYNGKHVLNKINLNIYPGEIFGLLGPSGAGKTTLINILTGQLQQTSGTAVLSGKDTREMDDKDYRKMGIMMERFGLYERLSCYDNLKLFARIYGVQSRNIDAALQAVGLWDEKKTLAMNLSKGMKSRLVLARVLMINPSVLFLDEPTSELDPSTANRIHQLILQEKAKGNTIFLTTHNMGEAEKLCDHIALLHEGKIVEYGSPEGICRKYNYQRKIKLHLYNGTDLEMSNDKFSAKEISKYLEDGMVETIHSTEPDLETVFMELTGRGLVK